jgi:hypothetical protein
MEHKLSCVFAPPYYYDYNLFQFMEMQSIRSDKVSNGTCGIEKSFKPDFSSRGHKMTHSIISMDMRCKIVLMVLIVGVIAWSLNNPFSQGLNSIDVFSIDSKPYNVTYSDWTSRWWQWALSIPANQNPVADNTGQYCDVQQEGPVWFLAGTFGGNLERSCTIPEGKALLFSPINGECNYAENRDAKSEADLRQCAKNLQDQVNHMEVFIDGVKLDNLEKFRIQSPLFPINFPKDNAFGIIAGPTEAVSDGNWVLLKPLPSGNHTIKSKGVAIDFTTNANEPSFTSDITYHLTIK